MTKTFGTNDEQLRSCDSIQLTVKPLDESMSIYLNAHTVDTICSPIVNQQVNFAVRNYKHLHDLRLAKNVTTENSSEEIEVLIGNDQMWNFFTGNVIRGQNGPVAMELSSDTYFRDLFTMFQQKTPLILYLAIHSELMSQT